MLIKDFGKAFNRGQAGQSLLEVAVSLGLVMIIITILTVTTITGLKNSQFAKNQVLASSYAQQGVEMVKAIKQRDCGLVTANRPGPYYWSDSKNGTRLLIWAVTEDVNPIPDPNSLIFQVDTSSLNCAVIQNSFTANGETLSAIFNRKIKLERVLGTPNVIRVTVIVTWEDASGPHVANNISLLTNY